MKITVDECLPLNFFIKLPPHSKAEIDELTLHHFYPDLLKSMMNGYYLIDILYTLTPEKWDDITKYADDFEYHTILGLWNVMQPIYKNAMDSTDLYQRYPEYLV